MSFTYRENDSNEDPEKDPDPRIDHSASRQGVLSEGYWQQKRK